MTRIIAVDHLEQLPDALRRLGIAEPRPVIVVIGGAATLSDEDAALIEPLVRTELVPVCTEFGAALVDGGTDSGVMRLTGRARAAARRTFPLVGVFALGTVEGPGATVREPAALESNHSGFIEVPGGEWGDESPWLTHVASAIAGNLPVVGVLVQGGEISIHDVGHLFDAGYPVVALGGTGRLADELAHARNSERPTVETLRTSSLLHPVDTTMPGSLAAVLRRLLGRTR